MSFIFRHPIFQVINDCDSSKDAIKKFIKSRNAFEKFMIEFGRTREISDIILDDMRKNERSIVNVYLDGMLPFNPNISNRIKIKSKQIPINVPFAPYLINIMDPTSPTSTIDNNGLNIYPSYQQRRDEIRHMINSNSPFVFRP